MQIHDTHEQTFRVTKASSRSGEGDIGPADQLEQLMADLDEQLSKIVEASERCIVADDHLMHRYRVLHRQRRELIAQLSGKSRNAQIRAVDMLRDCGDLQVSFTCVRRSGESQIGFLSVLGDTSI